MKRTIQGRRRRTKNTHTYKQSIKQRTIREHSVEIIELSAKKLREKPTVDLPSEIGNHAICNA